MGANLSPTQTLLFINNAICEDTMKALKSSCVISGKHFLAFLQRFEKSASFRLIKDPLKLVLTHKVIYEYYYIEYDMRKCQMQ